MYKKTKFPFKFQNFLPNSNISQEYHYHITLPPHHAIHVTHQFANHSFALLYQRSMEEPNLDSKDVHQSGLRVGYENHHCFLHGLVFLAWKTL